MQVMEITVAVLDCPFMAAISYPDDVNLKGKPTTLAQPAKREALPSTLNSATYPPTPRSVRLTLPTSLCP